MSSITLSPKFVVFGLVAMLFIAGCRPSLAPMFKDYEIADEEEVSEDVQERVISALEEVGWVPAEEAILPSVILTEERILNRRGIYKNTAVLEVLPVGDNYIRVLIHPYRDHLIGNRTKLPYLPSNIEKQIVPDLTASLESHGLYLPGRVPSDSLTAE